MQTNYYADTCKCLGNVSYCGKFKPIFYRHVVYDFGYNPYIAPSYNNIYWLR